ncbi:unnamed protein product [Owenia fusiformis]|uniref:Uncharacterized protein n=1 Tax=Owenia fusiformis TaxID=6347 RepID=A0A8J1THU4_OWEFU|nr:unnamed protein product [Owenia fusiformis]
MVLNSTEGGIIHLEPDIPVSIVLTLTSIVTILANIYIIIVIVKTKSLHTPAGYMMISLACTDFMVGWSHNVPLWYSDANGVMGHKWFVCQFSSVLSCVCCVCSIYTLGLLSLDKYLAITRPLRYDDFVTIPRCVILIIGVWVFSIIIWIPPLFDLPRSGDYYFEEAARVCYFDTTTSPYYTLFIVVGVFVLVSTVIGFCYFKILKISLAQSKRMAETLSSDGDGPKISKTNKKAIRTLLTIVSAFYIAWTPYCTERVIRGFVGEYVTPDWFLMASSTLAVSNSYFNAFIFTLTNRKFRHSAITIFMPYWGRNRVSPNTMVTDVTTHDT